MWQHYVIDSMSLMAMLITHQLTSYFSHVVLAHFCSAARFLLCSHHLPVLQLLIFQELIGKGPVQACMTTAYMVESFLTRSMPTC